MKNNYDLKKFLIENKLTANSRQIVNENQLPDATKDLKASAAFREVGIDMSKPVLVLTQDGGHGEQETRGTVSAQEALKMFQQLRANGMENDKQDYYEFENEINFSAEGYEYKIAYFEEESTTTALMQKSGVDELAAGGLEEKSAGKKLFVAFKKEGLKPNYIADARKLSKDGEAKDMVHIEPGEGSVEVSASTMYANNNDKIAQAIKSAGFNISKKEDNVGDYKLSVFTIDITR